MLLKYKYDVKMEHLETEGRTFLFEGLRNHFGWCDILIEFNICVFLSGFSLCTVESERLCWRLLQVEGGGGRVCNHRCNDKRTKRTIALNDTWKGNEMDATSAGLLPAHYHVCVTNLVSNISFFNIMVSVNIMIPQNPWWEHKNIITNSL